MKYSPIVYLSAISFLTLLFACNKSTTFPPPPAVVYTNWNFGEQAYKHTKKICDFGPRPIESKAHKKTQEYITSVLQKNNWIVTPQAFSAKTPYEERNFTNVIARYNVGEKGAKKTNSPTVLIAAHFDGKMLKNFIGADDAASSVGALLEIAENLPKADLELAKKIELIFFDGEEALKQYIEPQIDGLYGSYYYSNYLNNDLGSTKSSYQKRPQFGILLDMIGHKNLKIAIPSDTPLKLSNSYQKVVKNRNLQKQFTFNETPIIDDHLFMNEIAKVPTIDIIGDFSASKWWHTTNDDFSLISKESLSISIQVALEIINDQLGK